MWTLSEHICKDIDHEHRHNTPNENYEHMLEGVLSPLVPTLCCADRVITKAIQVQYTTWLKRLACKGPGSSDIWYMQYE